VVFWARNKKAEQGGASIYRDRPSVLRIWARLSIRLGEGESLEYGYRGAKWGKDPRGKWVVHCVLS
jgi:hypothetical protein